MVNRRESQGFLQKPDGPKIIEWWLEKILKCSRNHQTHVKEKNKSCPTLFLFFFPAFWSNFSPKSCDFRNVWGIVQAFSFKISIESSDWLLLMHFEMALIPQKEVAIFMFVDVAQSLKVEKFSIIWLQCKVGPSRTKLDNHIMILCQFGEEKKLRNWGF